MGFSSFEICSFRFLSPLASGTPSLWHTLLQPPLYRLGSFSYQLLNIWLVGLSASDCIHLNQLCYWLCVPLGKVTYCLLMVIVCSSLINTANLYWAPTMCHATILEAEILHWWRQSALDGDSQLWCTELPIKTVKKLITDSSWEALIRCSVHPSGWSACFCNILFTNGSNIQEWLRIFTP